MLDRESLLVTNSTSECSLPTINVNYAENMFAVWQMLAKKKESEYGELSKWMAYFGTCSINPQCQAIKKEYLWYLKLSLEAEIPCLPFTEPVPEQLPVLTKYIKRNNKAKQQFRLIIGKVDKINQQTKHVNEKLSEYSSNNIKETTKEITHNNEGNTQQSNDDELQLLNEKMAKYFQSQEGQSIFSSGESIDKDYQESKQNYYDEYWPNKKRNNKSHAESKRNFSEDDEINTYLSDERKPSFAQINKHPINKIVKQKLPDVDEIHDNLSDSTFHNSINETVKTSKHYYTMINELIKNRAGIVSRNEVIPKNKITTIRNKQSNNISSLPEKMQQDINNDISRKTSLTELINKYGRRSRYSPLSDLIEAPQIIQYKL